VIPPELQPLTERFEGFHRVVRLRPVPTAAPYTCPAGYWTIGFGELCQPDHPEITLPEARQRLQDVLLPAYVGHAVRLSPRLASESTRRLAAISDFIFNLGPARYAASTLRRKVDAADWAAAAEQIRRWVYGGGRKLPGLVLRREAEAGLLLPGA
jgi:lysozyme